MAPIFKKSALRWALVAGVLVAVLIVLTASLLYLNYTPDRTQPVGDKWLTYNEPSGLFHLQYPPDWESDTDLNEGLGIYIHDLGQSATFSYYPTSGMYRGRPILSSHRVSSPADFYHSDFASVMMFGTTTVTGLSKLAAEAWQGRQVYEYTITYTNHFPPGDGEVVHDWYGGVHVVAPATTVPRTDDVVLIPVRQGLFVVRLSTFTGSPYVTQADARAVFAHVLASLRIKAPGIPAPAGAPQAPTFPGVE